MIKPFSLCCLVFAGLAVSSCGGSHTSGIDGAVSKLSNPTGHALTSWTWRKYRGNVANTASTGIGLVRTLQKTVKWSLSGATYSSPYLSPCISRLGIIYFGGGDDKLYAADCQTGSILWTHDFGTPSNMDLSSPAVDEKGTVYIGGLDGKVYCFDGTTGVEKWHYATGSQVETTPVMGYDGTVYIGAYSGNFYALNGADGSLKWSTPLQIASMSSAAVGPDGTVYVSSGALNAIDPKTGAVLWSNNLNGLSSSYSPTFSNDGNIVEAGSGVVVKIDAATGKTLWTYSGTGGGAAFNDTCSAIEGDGTIVASCQSTRVVAIDPSTGKAKWTHTSDSGYVFVNSCIAPGGPIYVCETNGQNGNLIALNQSTGVELWRVSSPFNKQLSVGCASPALGPDGTIYVPAGVGFFAVH